jgi:hypothetical protein
MRMYNKNSGRAPSLANERLFVLYLIAVSKATAGLELVSFEHGNLYAGRKGASCRSSERVPELREAHPSPTRQSIN